MEKMKYDMAGGAAMIGAMRAIAQLKPNLRVIGIVCASENMPSGKAQKPGDVQIAMSGKSIEIINTDAEGRLVLADGLHYARQLGCTHLIDAATLTGACVVALGMVNAGIFANDEDFYERFSKSLQKSGEKMWRLPVDEEYREMIKSNIADIVNSGGRWGGAVTAAMFLKEFVGDTPWLHLDIAGVAWMEDNKPWIAKGPSGIPVRSLVEFVRDLAAGPRIEKLEPFATGLRLVRDAVLRPSARAEHDSERPVADSVGYSSLCRMELLLTHSRPGCTTVPEPALPAPLSPGQAG